MTFKFTQPIGQLEKRKGGYFYLQIDAAVVDQLDRKKVTRLICVINEALRFRCGLNHLGDGNFFIIISTQRMKAAGLSLGEEVVFEIYEDPDPLEVDIPEVLEALITQEESVKTAFDTLTSGKKRSFINTIAKVKSVDLQASKILTLLKV